MSFISFLSIPPFIWKRLNQFITVHYLVDIGYRWCWTMKSKHGYYILTHLPSGQFYVGSTANLDSRVYDHKFNLNRGTHCNRRLQSAFTSWDDVQVDTFPTESIESARYEEQLLLDRHHGSELCCNISNSATVAFGGVVTPEMRKDYASRLRRKQTPELVAKRAEIHRGFRHTSDSRSAISLTKSRPVLADGVRYESAALAAEAFELSIFTVRSRLRATGPKWTGWKFLEVAE